MIVAAAVSAGILLTGAVGIVTKKLFAKPSCPAPMPENIPSKSPAQLRKAAQKKMGMDTKNHYNFGVAGSSGTGKSSLVNALCKRSDLETGAAWVGVTETTDETSKYIMGSLPHVAFYDLAGGGTAKHPAETYFMDKTLYAFDFVMIVVKDRFRELDLDIAKNSHQYKIPFAFVRSNSDYDLDNLKRENPGMSKETIKENYSKKVRSDITDQLPPELGDAKVFMVSKWVLQGKMTKPFYLIDEDDFINHITDTVVERRNPAQKSPAPINLHAAH